MRKSLLALSVLALSSTSAFAADYSDGDIHKNDFNFMQFNYMYAVDEMPRPKNQAHNSHDYLEMEFGGRSGLFDLYGYVDVFNLANSPNTDKGENGSKMFMKFAPRVSLDALTGKDLSFGPVKELYVATLFNWGGTGRAANNGDGDVNNSFWGLGSDVMVPWLGKVGFNVYGLYDLNKKDWNGYQVSTNWFKPFYFFKNGSFISYQGYVDYQFGMKDEYTSASDGGVMFNGIYWHSEHFAVGYGMKAYKDVYGVKNGFSPAPGVVLKSSGIAHYVSVTYKF